MTAGVVVHFDVPLDDLPNLIQTLTGMGMTSLSVTTYVTKADR